MFGVKLSLTVIRERLPSFILYFLMFSKLPSLNIQGETLSVNGVIRTLSRIDRAFINLPMAETHDFHCNSHFLRTWETGPYRVTMQLYVWLLKNRLFGDTRANAF